MVYAKRSKLEAAIGLSRKWDAREAGREVARSAIADLKHPLDIFLLFSTIHYKDHGGFQELLNGVWDVLPKGTPLIGGTVASFINNNGCYSRGVTALAIYHPYMDIALGIGKNTKRNPKNAAIKCAKMIEKGLRESKYKNRFLIDVISGPIVPKFPKIKRINVIKSELLGNFFAFLGIRIFSFFGYALGKEDEVIKSLSQNLPNYLIIGGSAVDNGDFFSNYQFFNKDVISNSIVALGCSTDEEIFLKSETGLHDKGIVFHPTKSIYGTRMIRKIENRKAKEYLFGEKLGLSEDQIKNFGPLYYKLTYYLPISFDEKGKYSSGIGGVFGSNILIGHKQKTDYIALHFVKGNEIFEILDRSFPKNSSDYPFMLMFSSAIYPFIIRNKIFKMKQILDQRLGSTPYLVLQPTIENVRSSFSEEAYVSTYGFNALSLKKEECVDL